jgi:hypothetical protein
MHSAAGFTPLLDELLAGADTLVLEEAASTPYLDLLESAFNDVSSGRRKPELVMSVIRDSREVYGTLLRKIYRTHKKIRFERSPLTPNDIAAMNRLDLSRCSDLDEALA